VTRTLEPTDKLDAVAWPEADAATGSGGANGPEGEVLDWRAIDWRAVEADVRRLRQRIFTASQAGDLKKVTPTTSPKAHASGNSGSRSPAQR
jgi:RNA-directed DNA polymerase